jgi:pimeloyl-ACP methyl ester carboxylesterase
MLQTQDMVVRGVRTVVYDSDPDGSREAVVFVHGNPGPSDDWEQLVPATSKIMRTIAMDLPGYGRAEHPDQFDFTVTGYAEFLGALLEKLGVDRVHLVLHDFGGGFGLTWAASHPQKFASATLINTGVLKGYRWHRYARIWQTPILGELFQWVSSASMLQRVLDAENPKPLPRGYAERVASYADWPHKRAVLALYRASRDPDATFAKPAEALKQLDRPVCVIWGDGDPYLPVQLAEQQREVFARAEVHVLKGLGHWPFLDDPDAVSGILTSFLQRQLDSSQPTAASSAGSA